MLFQMFKYEGTDLNEDWIYIDYNSTLYPKILLEQYSINDAICFEVKIILTSSISYSPFTILT